MLSVFFFSSRRRHTRCGRDWSSDVCSSDLPAIVLAGFSQGGAMALHTSLRQGERLAGVLALSCSLPLADALAAEAAPANRDVPIFMAHGTHDPMIPMARAVRAREILTELGYRLEWHEYPMPHSVCLEEIRDISAWLATVLPRP